MIGIYLAIWNSWTFILFGIDKYKACHHRFRISENTLLIHACLGGRRLFRHARVSPQNATSEILSDHALACIDPSVFSLFLSKIKVCPKTDSIPDLIYDSRSIPLRCGRCLPTRSCRSLRHPPTSCQQPIHTM